MSKQVQIPDWLQALVKKVQDASEQAKPDWPNGQYPHVAFAARDEVGEYGDDAVVSLFQEIINEVERLRR